MSSTELIAIGHGGYGIAIDKYGKIWTTEYGSRFSAFDPADPVGTLQVFTQESGKCCAQGVATDDNGDVFIAGSLSSNHVGHYRQTFDANQKFTGVTFVANYTVGQAPTGVAVDSRGAVWSTNYNDNSVSRIQLAAAPAAAVIDTFPVGLTPYNYSDMTGRVVRTITNRQGTWEAIIDGGSAGFKWSRILWKLKQAAPEGTSVEFAVKTADQAVGLGAVEYKPVENNSALAEMVGRFLKLRVRLTSDSLDATPEVTEISLPKSE
jgi:streptogramin lyase